MTRACFLFAAGLICGAAPSYAASHIDPLVRMIEAHLSGMAHVEIRPGVEIQVGECQCTIRYDGTKIIGNHYDVGFDRLD